MERENEANSPEKGNRLNFVVRHDGFQEAINKQEKIAAASEFNALVEDLLVNHVMDAKYLPVQKEESLHLIAPIEGDDYWDIYIRDRQELSDNELKLPPSEQYKRDITLQERSNCTEGQCNNVRHVVYRLCTDSVVRRIDGDSWTDARERNEFYHELAERLEAEGEDKSSAELWQMSEEFRREKTNFAEAMGTYNQPVSSEEIKGLKTLLTNPSVKSV